MPITRQKVFLILLALWAGIFLPALGSIEVKGGEEGRRILPAIAMLESGDWLVPSIGGRPYLRKPPLLNWIIAGSFQLTGQRNEWTARLPSAFAILGLASVIVAVGSRWLTPAGTLLAGVFIMTSLGILEKGRLAEIEALYTALTGLAIIVWLAWWRDGRSPWLVWLIPAIFLGLGLLAKGPLLLLFFYTVVGCVLWQAGRLRELRSAPALVGVVLMVAIFAAWAVPYFREVTQLNAGQTWQKEFSGRVGQTRTFGFWIEEVWNHFENFLPWLLLAPFWWSRRILATFFSSDAAIFRGLRAAVVFCGAVLFFTPGVASRYTLPLIVPLTLLNVMVLRSPELLPYRLLKWWRAGLLFLLIIATLLALATPWLGSPGVASLLTAGIVLVLATTLLLWRHRLTDPVALTTGTGLFVVICILLYAVLEVPRVTASESSRPLARKINQALPSEAEELYVLNPGYRPALFYIRARCIYPRTLRELPPQSGYALLAENTFNRLDERQRKFKVLGKFPERQEKNLVLVEFGEAPLKRR